MSKPVFLEYDSEKKKAELIKLFEDKTQKNYTLLKLKIFY